MNRIERVARYGAALLPIVMQIFSSASRCCDGMSHLGGEMKIFSSRCEAARGAVLAALPHWHGVALPRCTAAPSRHCPNASMAFCRAAALIQTKLLKCHSVLVMQHIRRDQCWPGRAYGCLRARVKLALRSTAATRHAHQSTAQACSIQPASIPSTTPASPRLPRNHCSPMHPAHRTTDI